MYWKTEPREISKWTLWVGLSLLAMTWHVKVVSVIVELIPPNPVPGQI